LASFPSLTGDRGDFIRTGVHDDRLDGRDDRTKAARAERNAAERRESNGLA
jgi:hypothetical protein